jgi:hypothetical protein
MAVSKAKRVEYTRRSRVYKGNPLLRRQGIDFELTMEQMEELDRCSEDPIYFCRKYVKVVHVDRGLVNLDLYDYQEEIINSIVNNRNTIVATARQAGKALPLDTKIPTPNGWVIMGDILPGDQVFDENGQPTIVDAISTTFLNHDCYQLVFDDGSSIVADAEHLWTVTKRLKSGKRKQINITTKEMFDSGWFYVNKRGYNEHTYYIKNTKPVAYPSRAVTIDPYTLGVWLGDGTSASGSLTTKFDDLVTYQQHIKLGFGKSFSGKEDLYTGTMYGLQTQLRSYNLLKNKHIPTDFMLGDVETRISLLQGIMDTDGWVDQHGGCQIQLSNRYPQLLSDLYQLLVSLGIKIFRKEFSDTDSVRYSFTIAKDNIEAFRLPRKLQLQKQSVAMSEYVQSRTIQNIKRVDSVPTRCISVTNESHLFLCSEYFVPTHNTTSIVGYVLWYILFHDQVRCAILANKGETAREILSRIKKGYQYLPQWMQQGVIEWNKGDIALENGSGVMADATSSDAIRGYSINLLIIDEAAHIEGWDEFFQSTYPTISSGVTSKICLISTPNGLNHFYATWMGAHKEKTDKEWNEYNPIKVMWDQVPGRDDRWKQKTLAGMNHDLQQFAQEYCVAHDTLVTIRDTATGEIHNVSLGDLYTELNFLDR